MISGLMTVHHNFPENFIDDMEDFCRYCSWIICGYKGKKNRKIPPKLALPNCMEDQTPICSKKPICSLFIRPAKCNIKILNRSKDPAEGFGIIMVKIPETNRIIPLCPSYYMPQNTQRPISKTFLKQYNQFRSIIAEALRWLQITKDTVKWPKVEITVKEIYQQLLHFITIDVIEVE